MSRLKIRNAVKEDAKDIFNFINELAIFEKLKDKVNTSIEELRVNIFDNKYANVLLLEVDNKKIGFALFYYTFSTFEGKPSLYLEDFYIVSDQRNKGYGKETLSFLAKYAVEYGCARFEWSCLNWNQKAIDFYLGFGALPQTDWTLFRLEGNRLIGYKKDKIKES